MGVGEPPFCCHNISIHTKTHERPQLAETLQERPERSRGEQGSDESPQTGSTFPESKTPCDSLGSGTIPLENQRDPCYTTSMKTNNPYTNTLLEMGYDKQDTQVLAKKKTFPCVIHGRQYDTEEQYQEELHEFMNGM